MEREREKWAGSLSCAEELNNSNNMSHKTTNEKNFFDKTKKRVNAKPDRKMKIRKTNYQHQNICYRFCGHSKNSRRILKNSI